MERNNDLNLLYPFFKILVTTALEHCHREGLIAYVFEGWRSNERQAFLFAKGRTTPGPKITWANVGESWHAWGLACDIVFDADPSTEKIEWTWEGGYADKNGDNYDKLAKIFKSYGIEWLGDKNVERAHFQLTLGLNIHAAKKMADKKMVWAAIDDILKKQRIQRMVVKK